MEDKWQKFMYENARERKDGVIPAEAQDILCSDATLEEPVLPAPGKWLDLSKLGLKFSEFQC